MSETTQIEYHEAWTSHIKQLYRLMPGTMADIEHLKDAMATLQRIVSNRSVELYDKPLHIDVTADCWRGEECQDGYPDGHRMTLSSGSITQLAELGMDITDHPFATGETVEDAYADLEAKVRDQMTASGVNFSFTIL